MIEDRAAPRCRPIIDNGQRMFDQYEERCSPEACGAPFNGTLNGVPVVEPAGRGWSESSGDRADENESAPPHVSL